MDSIDYSDTDSDESISVDIDIQYADIMQHNQDMAITDVEKMLLHAVSENDIEMVRGIFSDCDVNPNIQNTNDNTLLHISVMERNAAIVRELLKQSTIQVNAKNGEGYTPLMLAFVYDATECIPILMADSRQRFGTRNLNGETVIHYIARRGSVYYLRLLADVGGASVGLLWNKPDNEGKTPLDYHLLSHGCNLEFIMEYMKLFDIHDGGGVEHDWVKRVIEMCMKWNVTSVLLKCITMFPLYLQKHFGTQTILTWAISERNDDCMEHLLELDSSVLNWNVPNLEGHYPILLMMKYGKYEWIQRVLERTDVYINPIDSEDNNIYNTLLSSDRNINEKMLVLEDIIEKVGTLSMFECVHGYEQHPYFIAIELSQPHILRMLLQKRIMIPPRSPAYPYTILGYAIMLKREMCMEELLYSDYVNVDINMPDIYGKTPYQLAVKSGVKRIVDKLLIHPNFNFMNIDGLWIDLFRRKDWYIIGMLMKNGLFNGFKLEANEMRQILLLVCNCSNEYDRKMHESYLKCFYVDYVYLYGPNLERCPDVVYEYLTRYVQLQIRDSVNAKKTILDLFGCKLWIDDVVSRYKEELLYCNMSPEESYNDSDPVSFEPFSEMESKDYIMYRCKKQRDTNGKFRVISCETLLQLALNSPYGYLESVLDPYTREPFVGVEVQVISWKPIWIDLLIRFFIRASQ